MPKSKRDKKVSLTKTPKKGMKQKQQLVEDIRKNLDVYSNVFIFTVHNMRNGLLKDLREDWKDSRFFFAKRKVMAIALGRTEAEESHNNLHKLAVHLIGQCGLLFTNRPKDQVIQWFRDYSKMDFAKSGFVATETVMLPAGPLEEFSFSIEPHLRSLGLPTQLEKGKVVLREEHLVCTKGIPLAPEQASLLKLLGRQMAEFKLALVCMWSKDGSFEKFKLPKVFKSTPKKIIEQCNQEVETDNAQNEFVESPAKDTFTETASSAKQEAKGPKRLSKTPKQPSKKSVDKTINNEFEETRQDKTPVAVKRELRRSMRTSLLKRSKEESEKGLEKITESTKQLKVASKPSKGTPKTPNTKKSKLSKSQKQLEDVSMSE